MAAVSSTYPVVIALEGELDLHGSLGVKDKINPVVEHKSPNIVIDLSDVTYIDSSGLALFIETLQRIDAYKGKLTLCGLRPSVLGIFELARLDQIFKISPDKASAMAA